MRFVAAKGVKIEPETNQGPARGHDQPISARLLLTHHPKTFNLTRMGVNKSTEVARTGWLSGPTWLQPGIVLLLRNIIVFCWLEDVHKVKVNFHIQLVIS